MITVNMSNESSLIHDPSKSMSFPNPDGTNKYIKADAQMSFNYKYFINHMITMYGVSSSASIKEYVSQASNVGAKFATYEQFNAMNFINAFFNGGSELLDALMLQEKESLKELVEIYTIEEDRKPNDRDGKNRSNYQIAMDNINSMHNDALKDAVIATGDYSTGKTLFMINAAIRSYYKDALAKNEPVKVTIVTNTESLKGQIRDTVKSMFGDAVIVDFYTTHGTGGALSESVTLPKNQLTIS